MKQSYIYKFIFLCNFLFGAINLNASVNNVHIQKLFPHNWILAENMFSNCQPIDIPIDGTIHTTSVPYFTGMQAECNSVSTIQFHPTQNSVILHIEPDLSNPYSQVSLYKVEDANRSFVTNLRAVEDIRLSNLEVGETYQLVFFQNYSSTLQTTVNYSLFYDNPITLDDDNSYVVVDISTYTIPELVTDVLISNDCVQVSNITYAAGNPNNPSIGYFTNENPNFPFSDGIILSTGYATSANGPRSQYVLSDDNGLPGDADLSAILGVSGYLTNATRLEFDFVPVSNQLSFNFIFASDEYGTFQCTYSDVFAFILTDLVTGVSTNLAVVPGTTTPVSVTTIRDAAYNAGCTSVNPEYFGNYYPDNSPLAPIDFRGHTVSLTAYSPVTPGNPYHIKLAIADFGPYGADSSYDSAVFIEGGSFDIGSIDLGDDLLESENNALCFDDEYLLQSGIDPDLFDIQWYYNNEPIPGANEPDFLATVSGTYKVTAQFIGTDCAISDEIIIEMYPRIREILNQPEDIEVCSNDTNYLDLTSVEPDVLGSYSASDFIFEYYRTLADLQNQTNIINNPQAYDPQTGTTIYMRLISTETNCVDYFLFHVVIKPQPEVTEIEDLMMCNNYQLPPLNSDETYYTGPGRTGTQYYPGDILAEGIHKIYIFRDWDGCTAESSFTVHVIKCDIPKGISPNNDGLNDYLDLTYYGVVQLKIYNRYGTEVYSHGAGYVDQWKGQDNNGNMLPDGTYFYSIVTLLDRYEGWIQVNK